MDRMEEKLAKASAFVEFFKKTSVKPEEANQFWKVWGLPYETVG